jgi:hypothetical protein
MLPGGLVSRGKKKIKVKWLPIYLRHYLAPVGDALSNVPRKYKVEGVGVVRKLPLSIVDIELAVCGHPLRMDGTGESARCSSSSGRVDKPQVHTNNLRLGIFFRHFYGPDSGSCSRFSVVYKKAGRNT